MKGGLRKRAGGGGRKDKYLFTGLLVCDVCAIKVPHKLVQDILIGGITEDLADPPGDR